MWKRVSFSIEFSDLLESCSELLGESAAVRVGTGEEAGNAKDNPAIIISNNVLVRTSFQNMRRSEIARLCEGER
jgi:hypothetical protein